LSPEGSAQASAVISDSETLTQRTVRGLVVQVSTSLGLKLLTIAKTFVFARLFAPEDFGIFATASMVVSFVLLFGKLGIRQAIIRHKEDPRRLMDTALTLSLLIGFLFFTTIFLIAPFAANLFNSSDLTLYVRFLSYSAFGATLTLPAALWDREMRFGISKLPSLAALVGNFTVTVVSAKVLHLATWSLFWGGLAGFVANTVAVWALAPYRPRPKLDLSLARQLYSFGWPLLISSILGFIVWQGDDLMVRYFWGDEELGYYTVAFYMPMYLTEIVGMVSSVLFPAFSKVQDSTDKLEYAFSMSNKYLAIISVPIGMGMCVFAPQIIHYLYTDKWVPAIPVLRVFAIAFMFRVATGYNWTLLPISRGRTKVIMYANLLGTIIMFSMGLCFIKRYGPLGGAMVNLANVLTTTMAFRYYVIKRELGDLSYLKQVWKPIVSGVVSAMIIAMVLSQVTATLIIFATLVILYLLIYVVILWLLEGNLLVSEARRLYKVAIGKGPA